MRKLLVVALGVVLASQSAEAQLFTDNFNSENGGSSALNYTGFANWTVKGQVDLVSSGAFGITCFGTCVDLDGSSGPGAIVTKSAFGFNSGDVMTFSFDASGNQRGGSSDDLLLRLHFGQNTPFANYFGTGGFSFSSSGAGVFAPTFTVQQIGINSSDPFSNWSFSFTAASSGSVMYELGTSSGDNVGPIVDNIAITSSAVTVPEPSTWAMMAAGLGALTVAARRRRRPL